jgi:hypothetical protein
MNNLHFLNMVTGSRQSRPNIIPRVEEMLRLNYVHVLGDRIKYTKTIFTKCGRIYQRNAQVTI